MAVLVAIAIPVFTTRLEQSRETTDVANLRAAYAAGQVAAISGDKNGSTVSGNKYYDPNQGDGLTSAGVVKGQGTGVVGKASYDGLPGEVTYTPGDDVRDKYIKLAFDASGLTAVSFAD